MLRARKKITKKELKQDALLEGLYNVESFIKDNSKLVTYGALAFIAIIIVSIMMITSKREAEINATAAVGIAQFKLLSGDFQDAIVRLEDAIRKYPGTDAVEEGTYYLATAFFKSDDKINAEKYFKEYIDEYSNDKVLTASSYAGLGSCNEDKGDFKAAASNYENAVKKAEGRFFREAYSLSAIRDYHNAAMFEEAGKMVENLLKDSDLSSETKSSLDSWKVQLASNSSDKVN